jgi:D-alanyl-D-alanine carboxypeptidase
MWAHLLLVEPQTSLLVEGLVTGFGDAAGAAFVGGAVKNNPVLAMIAASKNVESVSFTRYTFSDDGPAAFSA